MELAKKIVASILTISIIVFTTLAILSIWNVFSTDIAWKSIATMGVIALASILSLVVIKIVESKEKK